ncbi:MAG: hypothetical protein ACFFC3_14070, partial [Candidatus Odinarchaeota archaeon]
MDIISLIFQSTAFIAAFYVAIVIIRKDIKYIGNKLFVISFVLFGLYALVLFLYEFPISIIVNAILIGASLIIIVIGILFFVLSMQVFAQSSIFLKKPITKVIIIISVFVCILTFFFPYKVLQIQPEIEADKDLVSLLTTGIWVFILMIYNSIQLYKTLQHIEDPDKTLKNKITLLLIAQLIGILSPTMSVIGNITKNSLLHSTMFMFLAIP